MLHKCIRRLLVKQGHHFVTCIPFRIVISVLINTETLLLYLLSEMLWRVGLMFLTISSYLKECVILENSKHFISMTFQSNFESN